MSHWLEEAILDGLNMLDVEEALAAQTKHFGMKGEWQKGVISPSLVATECRLARVKIFLGLTPIPFDPHPPMAVRAGRKDPGSLLNMIRGFDVEGLMIEALRLSMPEHVLDSAPKYDVNFFDQETGYRYAGHPDVLMRHPDPDAGLTFVQIKAPTVFKMDRIRDKGDQDALNSYLPQMATEMYIARRAGLRITESQLLLCNWENTPKSAKPRVKAITLSWEESLATIPEIAAEQIHEDAARALMFNQWPEAIAPVQWDVWPCSYCRFARLGDFEIPGCDDHEKWRINGTDADHPGGGREADPSAGD